METNIYQSDLAIHPGEFLEEVLEDIGMSQADLSTRIGRPNQTINEIIKGKKSITPTTAIELEDVLSVPAHIWTGLESEYQMIKAKELELELIEKETKLLPNFPYLDLVKINLVKKTRNVIEKVEELKRFFGVAKLGQLAHIKAYQPAFRVSNHEKVSHEAIATWIQAGTVLSKKIETKKFDKNGLKKSLDDLKNLMNIDDINIAIKEIKNILAFNGIALVMLPHFKDTKVNGATFWEKEKSKAIILMSIRGGFSDIFWFSLFHELAHILLHDKREIFLENGYSNPLLKKQEDEADNFAKDFLINKKVYDDFINEKDFTKNNVLRFAKRLNIKPSIIVGRLMHEKLIPYNDYKLSVLRDRYQWA